MYFVFLCGVIHSSCHMYQCMYMHACEYNDPVLQILFSVKYLLNPRNKGSVQAQMGKGSV